MYALCKRNVRLRRGFASLLSSLWPVENSILNKSVWWFSTSPKFDFTRLKPQKSLILRRFFHFKPPDVHRVSHSLWRNSPASCGKVSGKFRSPQRPTHDKSEPRKARFCAIFRPPAPAPKTPASPLLPAPSSIPSPWPCGARRRERRRIPRLYCTSP